MSRLTRQGTPHLLCRQQLAAKAMELPRPYHQQRISGVWISSAPRDLKATRESILQRALRCDSSPRRGSVLLVLDLAILVEGDAAATRDSASFFGELTSLLVAP